MERIGKRKKKEWNKMMNLGVTVVHRGAEAKKVIQENGHEKKLDSRYVYTSDDGPVNGKFKAG